MGNEDESIEAENSSNDEVWTSREKDEEAREELPSVVPKDPNHEIPNGGFKAWLQVLGSFFLFLNSWFVSPPSNYTSRASYLTVPPFSTPPHSQRRMQKLIL
jgi:hypothetical protein